MKILLVDDHAVVRARGLFDDALEAPLLANRVQDHAPPSVPLETRA